MNISVFLAGIGWNRNNWFPVYLCLFYKVKLNTERYAQKKIGKVLPKIVCVGIVAVLSAKEWNFLRDSVFSDISRSLS